MAFLGMKKIYSTVKVMCLNTFFIQFWWENAFGGSDSSPSPSGEGRVFIFTTMRRWDLKLERSLPGQQSTQSNTPSVWVTPGPTAQGSAALHSPERRG